MKDFSLEFTFDEEEKEFVVEVFDADGDHLDTKSAPIFGDALRHAIYDYDQVLAAAAWTKDYFEYHEEEG